MNRNRGFTLAELMVVVAIIAALVAVAIPVFSDQVERSRETVDIDHLRQAYSAAKYAVLMDDYSQFRSISESPVSVHEPTGTIKFAYYDPATGSLRPDKAESTRCSKATQPGVKANVSALPGEIHYYGWPANGSIMVFACTKGAHRGALWICFDDTSGRYRSDRIEVQHGIPDWGPWLRWAGANK